MPAQLRFSISMLWGGTPAAICFRREPFSRLVQRFPACEVPPGFGESVQPHHRIADPATTAETLQLKPSDGRSHALLYNTPMHSAIPWVLPERCVECEPALFLVTERRDNNVAVGFYF